MSLINLLLLTFLSTLSLSLQAFEKIECQDWDGERCLYSTHSTAVNAEKIVIYLRGHWNYHGNVPSNLKRESINQVVSFYGLKEAHLQTTVPFIITSSSNVAIDSKYLSQIINKLNLPHDIEIILASHSGGHSGLFKTLSQLKDSNYKVSSIIMLDNFYFSAKQTMSIKEMIKQGSSCSGFYTQHNQVRFTTRFSNQISPTECSIEKRNAHNQDVNNCLSDFIKYNRCNF
jgi:hypothetical protein